MLQGLCHKTAEQCDRQHKCSKQTGPVHLCQEAHPSRECTK